MIFGNYKAYMFLSYMFLKAFSSLPFFPLVPLPFLLLPPPPHVYVACLCAYACEEIVFSFHCVGSRDHIQAIRLGITVVES